MGKECGTKWKKLKGISSYGAIIMALIKNNQFDFEDLINERRKIQLMTVTRRAR